MADKISPKDSKKQKSVEDQLHDERTLRRFTEQVLDCRQMEAEITEAENKRLSRKVELLSRETQELKAQLRARERSLQEAGDHIFRMQPNGEDITEAEAKEAFKALVNRVIRWVGHRLPATLEALAAGQLKKPSSQQAGAFLSLLRESGRGNLGVQHGEEYLVVEAIMYYIGVAFFSKSFYFPLDENGADTTEKWLMGMEAIITKTRGLERAREWRNETLAAMMSQKVYKTKRENYLSNLTADFSRYMTVVLPKTPVAELHSSIRKGLLEPAAELAQKLHMANSVYHLKWPLKTASSRLEVYECTNLANGGTRLDLSGTSTDSPSRRHAKYLFDIAPGLFVERVEGGKKTAIKAVARPRVLIHAGEGQAAHSATLMTWLYNAMAS